MAITIKTDEEMDLMRKSGKILAEVLKKTCAVARPGVSTWELDKFAEDLIIQMGGKPSFKGYHGFPCTICASINEEVVHSIPRKDKILQKGDLLTIDCGVLYEGFNTDAARSVGIGEISVQKKRLIETAYLALSSAIDMAKPGIHIGEISGIIQNIIEKADFHVIHELTGHGIGRKLHEDPVVLNYWEGNQGPMLHPGMAIAIEPIFSTGTSKIKTLKDNWTIVTIDNSPAVQVENTILITQNGNEVITE